MMYNMLAKHLAATAAIKLHVKQKTFMCASLLLALTVQAAIVVLPVCAHGVLFTDKHHFSYAHLHQPCSLQGTAHTEQFLWTNIDRHYKYTLNDSSRYSQHSAHHFNLKQEKVKGKQQFPHHYVLLSDSGMQVVHCYFCPLQRAKSRLK